ncbi:DUF7344 domain-containing protein [Haloarchaeobius sp. HRN-SO-5]|uniref:DUF7344 domain-containing protein n=1 Tax=Haloarchaeobius sp. HRN-SO-5 TaxID=3446118 RepID=UPI003EBA848A
MDGSEAETDAFTTLSDPHRRYVLYYLTQHDTPVDLDALATRVAAWSSDTTPAAVERTTVDRVRTELYHAHLPKLEELGVVTCRDDQREVDLAEDTELLQPYLDSARQSELGADAPE